MKRADAQAVDRFDLRQSWVIALLLTMAIPVFPEYVAPFLSILSLVAAMLDAKKHHRQVRVGATGKAVIALLCFAAVHVIWADNALFSGFTVICWVAMLCSYLAVSTVLNSPKRTETAMLLLSLTVGALGVLSCVQYVLVGVMGKDISLCVAWAPLDKWVFSIAPFKIELGAGVDRACSTFTNSNLCAQFFVMAIPLVASFGFTGRRRAIKVLARVSLLFGVAGLVLTFSRGAYLSFIAIAVVMCIANMRRLVPILMVGCSVLLLLPDSIYERLGTITDAADHTILERFELWGIGMELFLDAPLFGHGFGLGSTFEALQQAGFYNPHVHNIVVQFMAELGVVGVILLLYIIWKMFRTGFELIIHTPDSRMYGASVIAFCAGFCMFGMVDYPLWTPKVVGMFLLMLAFTDTFGFSQIKRSSCSVLQAIPFYSTVHDRLEEWVKKKTAPKDEREAQEET